MRYLLFVSLVLPLIIARPTHAQSAESVIQSLADPDREARRNAEQKLASMGIEARPALITASRSADPAIASVATRILLTLPWERPEDPQPIQQALKGYGALNEPLRIGALANINAQHGAAGWPVLLRIILEDPSEDVCWNIVTQLTGIRADVADPLEQRIRQLNPPDNRPAALVLVGRAWTKVDFAKSLDFYRRAVAAETAHPTYDEGELDIAFETLLVDAIGKRQFDAAADVCRTQCARIGVTRSSYPDPVHRLFTLHALYGPLQGFAQDLQNFSDNLGDPQVMYALARMYLRQGRLIEGLAVRDAARSATLSIDRRLELMQGFLQLGWHDFARLEGNAILGSEDPTALREQVSAHLFLNEIADTEENDVAAIEHLRQATTLMEKGQLMINGDPQLMAASIPGQIAWRTARIATAKSNAAEVKKALDDVVNLSPSISDVVLNTYPLLIKAGRDADATEMFNRVYTMLKTNLLTIREDRKAQLQNNLAWFLARCNQKLEEARDLSMQAVAAEPGNAAYIDTLAEIQFRLGNAEEAVKLESNALVFRPDDEFMHRQIERFRAGTVKKP